MTAGAAEAEGPAGATYTYVEEASEPTLAHAAGVEEPAETAQAEETKTETAQAEETKTETAQAEETETETTQAEGACVTVVMPVLHGPMGEDGTVQGLLELADVAYVGAGVLASAVCMDKAMAKTVLQAAGIAHPQWLAVTVDAAAGTDDPGLRSEAAAAVHHLGLPLFVKPANSGSSIGISRASDLEAVIEAMLLAARHDRTVILEEAVDGREIEVAVLGNDEHITSIPGEIVPSAEFYTYDDKYSDGAELLIPAPLDSSESAQVRSLAAAVCKELRVEGLARVDFFYEDGSGGRGWLVNEVNTMPGFTPISMYPKLWEATGLPYSELIDRLVELAMERHARRSRNTAEPLLPSARSTAESTPSHPSG